MDSGDSDYLHGNAGDASDIIECPFCRQKVAQIDCDFQADGKYYSYLTGGLASDFVERATSLLSGDKGKESYGCS